MPLLEILTTVSDRGQNPSLGFLGKKIELQTVSQTQLANGTEHSYEMFDFCHMPSNKWGGRPVASFSRHRGGTVEN